MSSRPPDPRRWLALVLLLRHPVHHRPRRRDRQRRAAVDRARPRLRAAGPAVGRRAPTRSRSAASCCSAVAPPTCSAAGASSWSGSSSSRPPRSACGLATSDTVADRLPRRAGPRRRDHLARRALDPHRPPSPRAPSATRRSASGAPSPASAARPACCSAASSPTSLGWEWIFFINVPDRRRRHRADPAPARREPRRRPRPATSTSRAPLRRPAGSCCWSTASSRPTTTAGRQRQHARHVRRGSAALLAAFFVIERRARPPLLPLRLFRLRTRDRRERRRPPARGVDLLDVLLPVALHAAGARVLGPAHRLRVPADRRHDHRLARRVAGPGHAARRASRAR